MKKNHNIILKEITDELALKSIGGGFKGTNQWQTGAQGVWGAIMSIYRKGCSWPGGFYGPLNVAPTASGTCVGGTLSNRGKNSVFGGSGKLGNHFFLFRR